MNRMTIAVAAALTVAAVESLAATTLYTSEGDYLAAVGATRTYVDFAGDPRTVFNGGTFSRDLLFGTCPDSADPLSCIEDVLHSSNAITDTGGSSAPNGVASLGWGFFPPDVFAFAFNYVSGSIAAVNLIGEDANGLFIAETIDTSSASGFIGIVSDTAYLGGIGVNAMFPNNVGNDRYFIDDFRTNALAGVPGPGGLAAIGVLLASARRARRQMTG